MRIGLGNLVNQDEGKRYVTINLSWDEIKALCSGGIIRSRLVNEAVDNIESQILSRFGIEVRDSLYSGNGYQELITDRSSNNGTSGT